MSFKQKILYAIGVMMIAGGLPFFIIGIFSDFKSTKNPEGVSTGDRIGITLLMGVLPIGAGFLICRKQKKNAMHRRQEDLEHTIMKLARECDGKVTIADVQMTTDLSFSEAQKLLEEYVINGVTEMEISESGAKVYRFRELISIEEKRRAEGF